jgi:hypothetical protein
VAASGANGRCAETHETATVPEVNNNDLDQDDDLQQGDPEPSASQQEELYD